MKNRNKILLVAVGSACGYLGYKYGKQVLSCVKNSIDRKPIEEIAKEIKGTMAKNVDDILKNTEELKGKVEGICNEALSKSVSSEDFCNDAMKAKYVTVPVRPIGIKEDIDEGISIPVEVEKKEELKEEVKKELKEELPPLDVKVSENPEEVRKEVKKLLDEAEKEIKKETVSNAAEVLKKRRAKNISKKKESKKIDIKEESKEEVNEESKEEVKEESKKEVKE